MSSILDYLRSNEQPILATLEDFVKAESPSYDKSLVDHCGSVLTDLFFQHLGAHAKVIEQTSAGNHLKFEVGDGTEQILVIGHFDTVWDPGRLTYRVEGDRIYGPGILDMKAGIIQALWGVKALQALNIPLKHKIVFLCNSDEEIGSPTSRSHIEEEAAKSKAVFVMEPAEAMTGALKTARKGIGIYDLKVRGASSHAGNHHNKGISAVLELAHQIQFLQGLTNYETGTTVNVGVIRGGTRSNVVPEHAEAEIDLRISTEEEARRMDEIMAHLTPFTKGTSIELSGGINRPPMERTQATDILFSKAQNIACQLGFTLDQATVGGGSDGNFTAAIGVPTLDGLGAVGDGPHAEYEHILVKSLTERAALFAHLVLEV